MHWSFDLSLPEVASTNTSQGGMSQQSTGQGTHGPKLIPDTSAFSSGEHTSPRAAGEAEQRAVGSSCLPPIPSTASPPCQPVPQGGTRLPRQMHPGCHAVLTLPGPLHPEPRQTRPAAGEGLSHRLPRGQLPARPQPEGLSLEAGDGAQAQRTLARLAGGWPSLGSAGLLPRAGQTPPWVPTCPGTAPPRSGGAVPKPPGPWPGLGGPTAGSSCLGQREGSRSPPPVAQLVGPAAGSPPGLPRLPPPAPGTKAA